MKDKGSKVFIPRLVLCMTWNLVDGFMALGVPVTGKEDALRMARRFSQPDGACVELNDCTLVKKINPKPKKTK